METHTQLCDVRVAAELVGKMLSDPAANVFNRCRKRDSDDFEFWMVAEEALHCLVIARAEECVVQHVNDWLGKSCQLVEVHHHSACVWDAVESDPEAVGMAVDVTALAAVKWKAVSHFPAKFFCDADSVHCCWLRW